MPSTRSRSRPYFLPRLIVGSFIGFCLGMLGVTSIPLVIAVTLVGLYFLGRPRRRHGVNTPFGRRMSPEHASVELGLLADWQAENDRLRVWRAGRDATPAASIPGVPINLDRPFTAYVDCERGHQDFHLVGATFHDGRQKWVNRSCALDGCDSVWREKA